MPRMTISYSCLLAFWIIASFVQPSLAQTNKLFQWGFGNEALSTSIPTCFPLAIVVKSFDPTTNSTNGTPPYYMIAFAVGGTPVTTLIGTDENNLSWTVTQPVGSQLVLSVVDANGSAGGIPPQILTVIPGQTTECVTAPPVTPPFTVTANVTSDLTTCQPWGLTVNGGVPPYTVTLAELNEPVVTNVTMPFGLNAFTFIDRANPNGQLIAAISDFTGRWATGTPIVNTQGSANVSCVGLVSSSGNATLIQQQEDAANAASRSAKRHHTGVTAVALILVLLLLMGLGGATLWHMRKRKREAEAELAEATPTQYVEPESKMLSIYLDPSPNQPVSGKAALALQEAQNLNPGPGNLHSSPSQTLSTAPLSYSHSRDASLALASNAQRPGSRVSNSGFVNFPATSIRRSAKASEAGLTSTRVPDSESGGGPSETQAARSSATRVNEQVVFQHRDAGVVRELPPPYRARRSRPSSS